MRPPLTEDELDSRLAQLGLTRDATVSAPPPSKNRTVVCRRGRQRVLVKVADGPGNVGVLREGSVLERVSRLASSVPNAPLEVPSLVAFDPAQGLLALDWLDKAETLHHYHRRTQDYSRLVARQVGSALGFLHQKSRDTPSRYALADAFRDESDLLDCFLRMRPDFYARLSQAGLDFFAQVQEDRAAMQGLEALWVQQVRESESCLLHGDMRQANLLRVGKSKLPSVVFVDWELSFWGDAARDLGGLLADYVQSFLAPEHKSEVLSRAQLKGFSRALLAAYVQERGGQFQLDLPFAHRVVRWIGAALLIGLYGVTHYEQVLDQRAEGLLHQARAMLADPKPWPEMFWGAP